MVRSIDTDGYWQVELGRQLALQKRSCVTSGQTWQSYVKDNCIVKRRRADELIRIGAGLLSVDDARNAKRLAQQRSRLLKRSYGKNAVAHHSEQTRLLHAKIIKCHEVKRLSKREIADIVKMAAAEGAAWNEFVGALLARPFGTPPAALAVSSKKRP